VDIHRLPMGPKRWFYDFTSSPLSQNFNTAPPEAERDPAMIFAHGERRMFCELNFHPPADADTAITFRAFSPARTNPFHEHVVTPHELGLAQRPA
jgi:hypothetical protein